MYCAFPPFVGPGAPLYPLPCFGDAARPPNAVRSNFNGPLFCCYRKKR